MNFNRRPNRLVAAMLLLFASAGCFGQDQPQRSIVHLSGDTYRAQDGIHHTVFVVTRDGIILADPINREFSGWLKKEFRDRFDVPVKYVLYSHHHWDHASGGSVFADTAVFVGHENMLHSLAMPPPSTPLPSDLLAQDADGSGGIETQEASGRVAQLFALYDADGDGTVSGAEASRGPVSDVRPPDITYRERARVSLGGRNAELTWMGSITHADDLSVIRFPEESVVFVVDFISIETMPFRTLGDGRLEEWIEAIRRVEAMAFDVVAPGHGSVGGKADVAEHRRYLEALRDGVAAGIAEGVSLDEMQEKLRFPQYSHWFMYDQWQSENVAGMYRMLKDQGAR